MRLLDLEGDAQSLLKHGRISVGHAKVLLSLKNHNEQKWLADQIVRGSLSVRIAEKLAAQKLADAGRTRPRRNGMGVTTDPSPAIHRVQNLLTHRLATRVQLSHSEKKGHIQIEYYGTDDLNRILELLGIVED